MAAPGPDATLVEHFSVTDEGGSAPVRSGANPLVVDVQHASACTPVKRGRVSGVHIT